VKDGEEAMINHEQRIAFEILADMVERDSEDARLALLLLRGAPFLHPHLREMIDARMQQPKKNHSSLVETQENKGIPLKYQVMAHAKAFNKEQTASNAAQLIASIRIGSCEQCPIKEHRRNKNAA
jgi:hypothetical protein